MWPLGRHARRRRIEERAYAWVVKIDEDKAKYEAGLRHWIGSDQERAEIYNRAYRAYRDAAAPAAAIYGSAGERRAIPTPRGVRAIPASRLMAMAAALIIIAAAGTVAVPYLFLLSGNSPSLPMSTGTAFTTKVGEVRPVLLSDGSRLLLDTDTEVDVRFNKSSRLVVLRHGRARFDVAHNAAWPFIVSAGGAEVTAKGTVFDVEVYDQVGVHLITGAIDVTYPTGPKTNAAIVQHLISGQKVEFKPNLAETPRQPTVAKPSDEQWVSGMKTFDDMPVSEIIAEAKRYSIRKIALADPTAGSREVFIDVNIRNPLEVARKLALLLDLRTDETRPDVIVLAPPNK